MQDPQPGQRVAQSAFSLMNLNVDPAIGIVRGSEGSVRLEPRVMAVLQMLARRPGELVSRADLLAEIWPGEGVYDEALTQCVYQLRQQLVSAGGEDCRKLITTVPKRGYVLEGEVRPVDAEAGKNELPRPRGFGRSALIGVLAALLVVVAVWMIFGQGDKTETGPITIHPQTLAVLPFLPVLEENRNPALELGMADTLIARLSGGEIVVRPISSVRRYGDMERDLLQAGRELGADAVVEGSIQRLGEAMRVTVRLLRVSDGQALWADTFNEPFSGIFTVQDNICERIANALAPELGQQPRKIPTRAGTSNTTAYERYLQGRYHLSRLTPADLRASVEYFREAVALDPGYAQAWLGLASVEFRIPLAGEAPPNEFYPQARQAALKALEIDPSLAEGHAMLGWIANWFEWDWAKSETHFRRAIELDPNDTESHLGYAQLLSNTGRIDEALAEVRRARELSPFYMAAAALEGGFLLRAKQPEEALQRLEAAQRMDENFWLTRVVLAGAYMAVGRGEDALAEAGAARRLTAGGTWASAIEIGILVSLGRRAEAEDLLGEMLRRSAAQYVPPYDLAVAYRALGDGGAVIDWLGRAIEVRDPKLALMGADPAWSSWRERPEFASLMQRMKPAEHQQ